MFSHVNNVKRDFFSLAPKLSQIIEYPVSIVHEKYYIEKVYRDSYYSFFSSKHFTIERHCQRFTLFEGVLSYEMLHDYSNHDLLEKSLIGVIVIRPTPYGTMGRSLINPFKLKIKSCFLRVTIFEVAVLGHCFNIHAFPFASQDSETMTCAETTVWSILEYYGNRYSEYKTILPSDIINELNLIAQQRVLPSTGQNYFVVSLLLKKFGFSPRLYAYEAYGTSLKVLFHYYVESGIPLAVGVKGVNFGHSVVCIGHAESDYDLSGITISKIGNIPYVDSCVFHKEYVMIDDNQLPYVIEPFDDFTSHHHVVNKHVSVFAVPLYKRIFLEAGDAHLISYSVLEDSKYGIEKFMACDCFSDANPMVVRLFLTTSRKFRAQRLKCSNNEYACQFYSNMCYPKFLWIAEISTYNMYKEQHIIGEVVIDATGFRKDGINNIISIRYGNHLGYRLPEENRALLYDRLFDQYADLDTSYDMYINNLLKGGV